MQFYNLSNCYVTQITTHNLGSRQLAHVFGGNSAANSGLCEGVGELGVSCGTGVEDNSNVNCYSKQNSLLIFGTMNCDSFPIPQRTSLIMNLAKETDFLELTIYPNPSKDKFKLSINTLKDKEDLRIYFVDVLGKEILNKTYQEEIDISHLEKGIYFLSLYQNGSLLSTKKVVKE